MYRYLDQPIAALDPGSQFILWAIRGAADAIASKHCLGAVLGPGFARYGAGSALPHFAMAVAVFTREVEPPVDIMPPGDAAVTEHEALLIAMFVATDLQADARVHATLSRLLARPDTLATAHRAMRTSTAHLLSAGMTSAAPDVRTGGAAGR